jgi:hypothetical protein
MTTTNLKAALKGFSNQCRALNGLTAHPGALDGMETAFNAAIEDMEKGNERKVTFQGDEITMADLMDHARKGVTGAARALNALRMETVDLYVRASSVFGTLYFEPVTLKDNEQVAIQHKYRNPTKVKYLGQDGGAETVKAVAESKILYRDLKPLSTVKIGYKMWDLNLGPDVADAARATVDLNWDMANKVDCEAFNIMQGGAINGKSYGTSVFGNFTTTGAKLDRTYIAHPRIQSSNLPTTNLIVNAALDDSAAQNYFRLAVIRAIMKYCDSWGNIMGLRPTGAILIPSSETTSLTKEITPTGSFSNEVAGKILQSYTMFSYMGVNWTLIGDPTLPPGACYPVLNKPLGQMFLKPQFDKEFVKSDEENNWETRSMMKGINFSIIEPARVNALKVVYSSVAGAGTVTTNE